MKRRVSEKSKTLGLAGVFRHKCLEMPDSISVLGLRDSVQRQPRSGRRWSKRLMFGSEASCGRLALLCGDRSGNAVRLGFSEQKNDQSRPL